jgi:hypothetical protein
VPIREGETFPTWADGDHILYNDYVITIARGGVLQLSPDTFLYRANTRTEITDWLLKDCIHDGLLTTNEAGYLSSVQFDTKQGAMEFKLRWYENA